MLKSSVTGTETYPDGSNDCEAMTGPEELVGEDDWLAGAEEQD